MKNLQKHSGFSLIELMIAIAIIGILASIAVGSYSSYVRDSKISAASSDLTALSVAIENKAMKKLSYEDPDSKKEADSAYLSSLGLNWSPSNDESFKFYIDYEASGYTITAEGKDDDVKACVITLTNDKALEKGNGCD